MFPPWAHRYSGCPVRQRQFLEVRTGGMSKFAFSYPSLASTVPACRGFVHIFRPHFQPGWFQAGVKSESVLVSRAARNWRPPVRRSRRHRPPPFGLPCRTRPFLQGPLLPGQPRFPFPAVACFPAPKGLRLAELGTCGERPSGGGLWYSGPWPVFPAFPGVREVIMFT